MTHLKRSLSFLSLTFLLSGCLVDDRKDGDFIVLDEAGTGAGNGDGDGDVGRTGGSGNGDGDGDTGGSGNGDGDGDTGGESGDGDGDTGGGNGDGDTGGGSGDGDGDGDGDVSCTGSGNLTVVDGFGDNGTFCGYIWASVFEDGGAEITSPVCDEDGCPFSDSFCIDATVPAADPDNGIYPGVMLGLGFNEGRNGVLKSWNSTDTGLVVDFTQGGATGDIRLVLRTDEVDAFGNVGREYCATVQSGIPTKWNDFRVNCWDTGRPGDRFPVGTPVSGVMLQLSSDDSNQDVSGFCLDDLRVETEYLGCSATEFTIEEGRLDDGEMCGDLWTNGSFGTTITSEDVSTSPACLNASIPPASGAPGEEVWPAAQFAWNVAQELNGDPDTWVTQGAGIQFDFIGNEMGGSVKTQATITTADKSYCAEVFSGIPLSWGEFLECETGKSPLGANAEISVIGIDAQVAEGGSSTVQVEDFCLYNVKIVDYIPRGSCTADQAGTSTAKGTCGTLALFDDGYDDGIYFNSDGRYGDGFWPPGYDAYGGYDLTQEESAIVLWGNVDGGYSGIYVPLVQGACWDASLYDGITFSARSIPGAGSQTFMLGLGTADSQFGYDPPCADPDTCPPDFYGLRLSVDETLSTFSVPFIDFERLSDGEPLDPHRLLNLYFIGEWNQAFGIVIEDVAFTGGNDGSCGW